ncbi:hypothetical protein CPB83DRAFT_521665 [Crepidotus variabilis]|uniref:SH3 domain-containing protein n=1 Tax=Crepidotus variabilis TaxID=179855 RepID=A0A9P6EAU9_9AGAR|nr:hypothetical protein CPB83DRAFT_521665 [Crepidotus variabilis]
MPSILTGRAATPVSAAADSSQTISNPIYIVGIVIICLLFLAAAVWLGRRYFLKRQRASQDSNDVGFLSVKGLVPETSMEEKGLQRSATQKTAFSRDQMNATIPMPERTLPPRRPGPGATREEIIEYHRQSGILPSSFAPAKPFAFVLNSSPTRSSFSSDENKRGSKIRNSIMSFAGGSNSGSNRQSVFSLMSTQTSSSDIQASQGLTRKVRQIFSPVLPDELLLTKVGEPLTIVQSFDDGWCVVGRENPFKNTQQTSLFKSASASEDANVELGCVPAWCFLKPVKGLRAERPMRSSSLGITVNMDGPASRNDLMSWSNF